MSEPAAGPLDGYSLMDPRIQSDPYDFYGLLHEHAPVYRMPETGLYIISRYDDVRAVLLNTADFSSTFGESFLELQGKPGIELYDSILREHGWLHTVTLQRADPPLHSKHRRMVDGAFSAPRIRTLTPHIDALCHRLIDSFIDRGECEFINEFALPLPGMVVAGELGLDPEEFPTFKRWADALLAPIMRVMAEDELRANAELEIELQRFLARLREERRANPGSDLISVLANAQDENGEPLSMREYQNILHQLISGGFDTLTSAMGHGLWLLIRHPEQMAKLRANPALLSGFIDETLRFDSPAQGLMRRAVRDVTIADTPIPAGSIVVVRYGAANHDAAHFACPHEFDIERRNAATHLAFGNGIHFCIGRLLARQEMRSAFTALLDRLDDIQLSRALPDPPHHPSILLRPLKELPIRFARKAGYSPEMSKSPPVS